MKTHVRVIQGSASDSEKTNQLLAMLKILGVTYKVSIASCHRNAVELGDFVKGIEEKIIVFIGGMSLAAPGIIRATLTGMGRMDRIVYAIPLDTAARSAVEDLPTGTPLSTSGLNSISAGHGINNAALAVAHILATFGDENALKGLQEFYFKSSKDKPLINEVALNEDGYIPSGKEGK